MQQPVFGVVSCVARLPARQIYVNITRSLGDVHHFAWRARSPRWVAYDSDDDARYADWTHEECSSRWDTPAPPTPQIHVFLAHFFLKGGGLYILKPQVLECTLRGIGFGPAWDRILIRRTSRI
jgi:hypothetical protein